MTKRKIGSEELMTRMAAVSRIVPHFKIVSCERNVTVKSRCDLPRRNRANLISRQPKRVFLTERIATMENKSPIRIFADDMAVTSKYWETVIRKSYSQPEKELMLAVLKD